MISNSIDYRPDVDGLRAIAVSAVIAQHFAGDLLPGGFLGVDMFFVISGYVITASVAKHPHDSLSDLFLGFYSRRIKRLLPALVVSVLITCLVGALFVPPGSAEYNSSLKAGMFSLVGLSNIFFYREATDYFGAAAAFNLFTHTWSLGAEEQFYFVFPALFCVTSYASRHWTGLQQLLLALATLSILSFGLYLWPSNATEAYFLMPPRFWELGIGCLTAIAISPAHRRFQYMPWLAALFLTMTLVAPAYLQLYTTPMVVIATAVLIMTIHPKHPLFQLLTLRGILLLGLMSYSLYLWHWPVLSISRWTTGIHWWTAPFQLALMLSLATASYFFIERPLRRAEWSASRFATIGIGVIAIVCSGASIFALKKGFEGVLYTGNSVSLVAKGVETLLDDKWYEGKLQWHAKDCVLTSNEDVGKKIDADACTLKPGPGGSARRFLVIGNSYNVAEYEMYSVLSEKGLGSVIVTSSWGSSPAPELLNNSPWDKANAYYWSIVIPELISRLAPGDVVIMIFDIQAYMPERMRAEQYANLGTLRNGLNRLSTDLRRKDIQIIFQTTMTFIRDAKCTPDLAKPQWFSRREQCTYYTKSYSLNRRQPLTDVLKEVESANPNFHVLDLFPVFCPGETCRFFNSDDVCLYRDVWAHPSIEANYLARSVLLSTVEGLVRERNNTTGNGYNGRAHYGGYNGHP